VNVKFILPSYLWIRSVEGDKKYLDLYLNLE